MKILFLISFMSFNVFANVQSGDPIRAIDFNNKTFAIGDVKTSILTNTEFSTIHGNCWIQLNNNSLTDITISGSDLAALKNVSTIKSSAGRVLRAAGGLSEALGTTQEDEFKSHTHVQNPHSHGTINGINSNNNTGTSFPAMATINNRDNVNTTNTTAVNQTTGGTETRMKNLTVNMFVKINNNCN